MLKLQYLIAFTDIGILLNKLPDTFIMRIHYSHVYASTIYEISEIGRIGYGLYVGSCLLNK